MEITPTNIDAGGKEYLHNNAKLRVWIPTSEIVIVQIHGNAPKELAVPFRKHIVAHSQNRVPFTLYCEFTKMYNYDSAFRISTTQTVLDHKNIIKRVEVLSESKFVAMGAAVANLALGGMLNSHSSQQSFFDTLETHCQRCGFSQFLVLSRLLAELQRTG